MADADETRFREYLRTIWFGMYSRAKNVVGSSGFEHVFVGELKNGISGLHSWVRYAMLEQLGELNYLGYTQQIQLGVVRLPAMFMRSCICACAGIIITLDLLLAGIHVGNADEVE